MGIITPLLVAYGKHFTKAQWEHWAAVLGFMGVRDLTDSVKWWMDNRDQFPPSPAALKSHALDQVKKKRHSEHELGMFQRMKDSAPTEAERIPHEQAQAYCAYIVNEIIGKKRRAPERANKERWYESEMEKYYDNDK